MNILKNKRGALEEGLSWTRDIILLLAILVAAYFVINGISSGDLRAQNAARNFGSMLDVVSASPDSIKITSDCPTGVIFEVESDDNSIEVTAESSMGTGTSTYHFLAEKNAKLVDSYINCMGKGKLVVEKTVDKSTGAVSIDIRGED